MNNYNFSIQLQLILFQKSKLENLEEIFKKKTSNFSKIKTVCCKGPNFDRAASKSNEKLLNRALAQLKPQIIKSFPNCCRFKTSLLHFELQIYPIRDR